MRQLIIARKDLQMSPGKLAAQCCHASLAFLTDPIGMGQGVDCLLYTSYMTGEQSYRYYNEFLWPDRYADCVPMDKALELLKK